MKSLIDKAFIESGIYTKKNLNQLFCIRSDGVMIHSTDRSNSAQSLAVLMAGSWQAAEAMSDMIPGESDNQSFRFSFDTTSKGIYITSFEADRCKYFLGCLYCSSMNPGKLKMQIRGLQKKLEVILTGLRGEQVEDSNIFAGMSDNEIDKIFENVMD